jgi:hypothetical protein
MRRSFHPWSGGKWTPRPYAPLFGSQPCRCSAQPSPGLWITLFSPRSLPRSVPSPFSALQPRGPGADDRELGQTKRTLRNASLCAHRHHGVLSRWSKGACRCCGSLTFDVATPEGGLSDRPWRKSSSSKLTPQPACRRPRSTNRPLLASAGLRDGAPSSPLDIAEPRWPAESTIGLRLGIRVLLLLAFRPCSIAERREPSTDGTSGVATRMRRFAAPTCSHGATVRPHRRTRECPGADGSRRKLARSAALDSIEQSR